MVNDKKEIISALTDYVDAKELYDETVKEIARLKSRKGTMVQDSVKGSMQEFPYAAKNFHVAGIVYSCEDDSRLREDEEVLAERARITGDTKIMVERYMNRIPARMQRIIKYKLFERVSWDTVAARLGGDKTGDAIRKEFDNFVGREIKI